MVDMHRLNPNGMLVLLGTMMYVVVGGPTVVLGGLLIAVALGVQHRPGAAGADDDGPMSLFGGTPATIEDGPAFRPGPFLQAVRVPAMARWQI